MNGNTKFCVSNTSLLPLLTMASFLLISPFAMSREPWGVPFQQTEADIIEEHYQNCKKNNPSLTREAAKQLDQTCSEFTPRPAKSPEELKATEDNLRELIESRMPVIDNTDMPKQLPPRH